MNKYFPPKIHCLKDATSISGLFSTTDDDIAPTGVRYIEVPLYIFVPQFELYFERTSVRKIAITTIIAIRPFMQSHVG